MSTISFLIFFTTLTISFPSFADVSSFYQPDFNNLTAKISDGVLLAQSTKRKSVHANMRVKSTKRGDKTEIDLDEAVLQGSARDPSFSAITSKRAATDYNFVKLRTRWHLEMINSTHSLDLDK